MLNVVTLNTIAPKTILFLMKNQLSETFSKLTNIYHLKVQFLALKNFNYFQPSFQIKSALKCIRGSSTSFEKKTSLNSAQKNNIFKKVFLNLLAFCH
jgi:hypothetical protein